MKIAFTKSNQKIIKIKHQMKKVEGNGVRYYV